MQKSRRASGMLRGSQLGSNRRAPLVSAAGRLLSGGLPQASRRRNDPDVRRGLEPGLRRRRPLALCAARGWGCAAHPAERAVRHGSGTMAGICHRGRHLKVSVFLGPANRLLRLGFLRFLSGMLRLRFGTGFKLLLAGLWAPFGYGLARFMGYAGVWAMEPHGHLDGDMIHTFALFIFFSVLSSADPRFGKINRGLSSTG